eukprot:c24472_g7_i1 orf=111-632(+)
MGRSSSGQSDIELYLQSLGNSDNYTSSANAETDRATRFTDKLETLQSKQIGDDLESLSLRDLILLEQQLYGWLQCIRAKKAELILEQLEGLKEEVREAWRTTNASSNSLENCDFCPSEVTGSRNLEGQGESECCHARDAPQTDASLAHWVATSEQSNRTFEAPSVAKRTRITE